MSIALATGIVTRPSPNNLQAQFVVNGITMTWYATISGTLPDFSVSQAIASGTDLNQMTAAQSILGGSRVGADTIQIELQNGLVIHGTIDSPLQTAHSILGSGFWGHSGANLVSPRKFYFLLA